MSFYLTGEIGTLAPRFATVHKYHNSSTRNAIFGILTENGALEGIACAGNASEMNTEAVQ